MSTYSVNRTLTRQKGKVLNFFQSSLRPYSLVFILYYMNMVSVTLRHIKVILHGIVSVTLLIVFYFLYLESALMEFNQGRTTIAQSQEVSDPDPPVLVACTDPPFKPSFFKDHGIGFNPYFWVNSINPKINGILGKLEKNFSMMNVFTNMSYKLGYDWNIYIIHQKSDEL